MVFRVCTVPHKHARDLEVSGKNARVLDIICSRVRAHIWAAKVFNLVFVDAQRRSSEADAVL